MAEDQKDVVELLSRSDQLLVDYLESTENYLRSVLDEEKLLKEGFINIAHARICMKPNLISLDGFPNETTEVIAAAKITAEETTDGASVVNMKLQSDSSKDLELRRLFGRSTPGSLKNAQLIFQRVLARSVERANIFRELQENEKKIKDLRAKLQAAKKIHDTNIFEIENLSISN
ncbi:unnamed protein product [Allacma fusca]|uniref:Vacuolar ATPase assembly protein VMA22 n=1 Tax=Allacma fusca TaxID=39272 RepID=A0A8J2JSS6_9HEXA|nr:unnamed protein product [Allacma fusca]